jgi:chromosome segregation ATPase
MKKRVNDHRCTSKHFYDPIVDRTGHHAETTNSKFDQLLCSMQDISKRLARIEVDMCSLERTMNTNSQRIVRLQEGIASLRRKSIMMGKGLTRLESSIDAINEKLITFSKRRILVQEKSTTYQICDEETTQQTDGDPNDENSTSLPSHDPSSSLDSGIVATSYYCNTRDEIKTLILSD